VHTCAPISITKKIENSSQTHTLQQFYYRLLIHIIQSINYPQPIKLKMLFQERSGWKKFCATTIAFTCFIASFSTCETRSHIVPIRSKSLFPFSSIEKRNVAWKLIPRGGDDNVTSEPLARTISPEEVPISTSEAASVSASAAAIATATAAATAKVASTLTNNDSSIKSVEDIRACLMTLQSMILGAVKELSSHMKGPKTDTLLLLITTALNTPICNKLKTSPILGYLILGTIFGPHGKGLIKDIHTTELLADIGIVFFLFEMGIHLNFDTLMKMRADVFGLGLSQFLVTGTAIAAISSKLGLSQAASIVLGGGLALSSSAFVLQLLKDKNELSSQYGKSSFGVLLLQDLAVVPLMVATPLLAGTGGSVKEALSSALVQACLAIGIIGVVGKVALQPFFELVSQSKSQEALVGAILSVVLGMSFLTEGLGLSNTLGAFLAGVLLSDTPYKHQVEVEVAPIRGILVGLFFFSVGFEIDLKFIMSKLGLISKIVGGIVGVKFVLATSLCLLFGLKFSVAQRTGFILSQGGEFAILAFRVARSYGILDEETTKLLLTCVSLTMAITPFLENIGSSIASKLEVEDVPKKGDKVGKNNGKKKLNTKKKK